MKKLTVLLVLLSSLFFTNCEEVIDVNLDTAPPKLVIDAFINWEKGTTGNQQTIKLSTTTDYFSNKIPAVSNATIFITNSQNIQFDFNETSTNPGTYVCTNFIPVIDETYILTVISEGETYTASETLKSVAPITRIEQNNEGGILGDEIQIKAFYNDPPNIDNYYMSSYSTIYNYVTSSTKTDYHVDDDKFYQGNEYYSLSQNEDLEIGDTVKITHFGISKTYYNYMKILIDISSDSGNPFQSPSATVRGNIINQTNFDNFALGYFALCESDSTEYTIQ